MTRICVSGSKGKIGTRIIELAGEDSELEVSGMFDIGEEPESFIEGCDCLIEFTSPEATMEHMEICRKSKKAMVIGTTGLSESDKEKIEEASKDMAIVFSPNMSIGVNLVFKMVKDAAKVLSSDYSIEIVEAHHIHKKDSPSGTAKELARIIKEVKGDIEVPIESIREDEIVGEHTVTFDSPFDTIEVTHSAKTRDIFVKGALSAAKFAASKKHGLFSMKDVLAL